MPLAVGTGAAPRLMPTTERDNTTSTETSLPAFTPPTSFTDAPSPASAPASPKFATATAIAAAAVAAAASAPTVTTAATTTTATAVGITARSTVATDAAAAKTTNLSEYHSHGYAYTLGGTVDSTPRGRLPDARADASLPSHRRVAGTLDRPQGDETPGPEKRDGEPQDSQAQDREPQESEKRDREAPDNQTQESQAQDSETKDHSRHPAASIPENAPPPNSPPEDSAPSRLRRSRPSMDYNLARLSGTAGHGKRLSKGDTVTPRSVRRRAAAVARAAARAAAEEGAAALGNKSETKPEDAAHVDLIRQNAQSDSAWSVPPLTVPGSKRVGRPRRDAKASKRLLSKAISKLTGHPTTNDSTGATLTTRTTPNKYTTIRQSDLVDDNRPTPAPAPRITMTSLGKRVRHDDEQPDPTPVRLPRELRRLQDTDEFSRTDSRPVLQTVWSKGKLVILDDDTRQPSRLSTPASSSVTAATPDIRASPTPTPSASTSTAASTAPSSSSSAAATVAATAGYPAPSRPKRQKAQEEKAKPEIKPQPKSKAKSKAKAPEPEPEQPRKRIKRYLDRGLYAGQPTPTDFRAGLTPFDRMELAKHPELQVPPKPNSILPGPMFGALKLMIYGRDYKLPFDVCHPNEKQPKPDEWRVMSKNRFIGEARHVWKIAYHDSSKCVCKPEDGCGESCQNRSMLYECDDTNCNIGRPYCTNRAFADLAERRSLGNKYRIGVEVLKTEDRGYGVRSNRCFEPGQIIMEYNGEIITDAECERRMNAEYKDNECYYLMSFDQNMIIDATTGSIARFVNHSCNPNCQMIKWIVAGQPRVALFAAGNPINTGDELTYDYNFDPFSAKNVQKCLCGESNCRGVLGPRPKDKPVRPLIKPPFDVRGRVKGIVKAGKRKLKELMADDDEDDEDEEERSGHAAKRRKMQAAAMGLKDSVSSAGSKISQTVKAAAAAVTSSAAKATIRAQSKALKSTTTTIAPPTKPVRVSSRRSTSTHAPTPSEDDDVDERSTAGDEGSGPLLTARSARAISRRSTLDMV